MFSGGWQHHRNSRQQELSMNRSIEPSTTSPPPPLHTHTPVRWEIWTWNVKLTPFLLSGGIHMVPEIDPVQEGKCRFCGPLVHQKGRPQTLRYFSKLSIKNLVDCLLWTSFQIVYIRNWNICFWEGAFDCQIWRTSWAFERPFGPAGRGIWNLEFGLSLNTFQSHFDIK